MGAEGAALLCNPQFGVVVMFAAQEIPVQLLLLLHFLVHSLKVSHPPLYQPLLPPQTPSPRSVYPVAGYVYTLDPVLWNRFGGLSQQAQFPLFCLYTSTEAPSPLQNALHSRKVSFALRHGLFLLEQLEPELSNVQPSEVVGATVVGSAVVGSEDVGTAVFLKQQSALLDQSLVAVEKSVLQLLLPHFRPFPHSVSKSQSPWPRLQGRFEEQQVQSVVGTPLHAAGEDVTVVVLSADVLPVVVGIVVAVVVFNAVVFTVSIHCAQFSDM